MEKGSRVSPIEGAETSLAKGKHYTVEYLDSKLVSKGDGPASIRKWLRLKLKGIPDLQWAKDFVIIH